MKLLALKNGEIEVLKRACLNPKQESEIEALLKEAEAVLVQFKAFYLGFCCIQNANIYWSIVNGFAESIKVTFS